MAGYAPCEPALFFEVQTSSEKDFFETRITEHQSVAAIDWV